MAGNENDDEETNSAEPTARGLRYVGDGEYILGVPARNLTGAEAADYAAEIAATAAATGRVLYVPTEE